MIQNAIVAVVLLLALVYLIRRVFMPKKSCGNCGVEASKKQ
jgi:hypothetical protein